MSIRSDVGVAVKKDLLDKLAEKRNVAMEFLETADEKLVDAKTGARLFVFRDWKWFRGAWGTEDVPVSNLYSALEDLDAELSEDTPPTIAERYKIVSACHEYPDNDAEDAGDWNDNPWNLRRVVSVELLFEE